MVMNITALIPIGLGLGSVLQAGLNRKVADSVGIVSATVVNNIVLLIASLAVFAWARRPVAADIPGPVPDAAGLPVYFWFVPGLLGLLLVAGIPATISKLGALQVFTPLIAAQIIGSVLWDVAFEGRAISVERLIGGALVAAGAYLISMRD